MNIYSIPTVKVVNPRKEGNYRIINESDYDPDVHTLWMDSGAPAPDPAPGIQDMHFGSDSAEALAAAHGLMAGDMVGTGKDGGILIRDVRAAIDRG